MSDAPPGKNPRQLRAAAALVVLLGGLLVATKTADGWDARQWLIGGAIVLWSLGPAVAGGLLGAHLFSRSRSPRRARGATAGLALGSALLAAAITGVLVQPDTKARLRPGASRFPFASDLGLLVGTQALAGALLAGYFARHAAYLHARRWGKGTAGERPGVGPQPAESGTKADGGRDPGSPGLQPSPRGHR